MVFLSCDWGSTSLRLRAVEAPGLRILRERRSPRGSSGLLPPGTPAAVRAEAFARCLAEEIEALGLDSSWAGCPVIASGMVTSAHGWLELPYARTPFALDGSGLAMAGAGFVAGHPVTLVSGLTDGADVMRGEECELLGLTRWEGWAAAVPAAGQATVILPGTHCKHVRIAAGQVHAFRTYMTGELYALLRRHSVLRHSLPGGDPGGAPDPEALRAGALAVREMGLAGALFRVRTGALLGGMGPAAADAFLQGILIGSEFTAGALPQGGLVLAAGEQSSPSYAAVLRSLGWGDRLTVVPPPAVAFSAALGHAVALERLSGKDCREAGAGACPASGGR